ncbi:MAG: DUF1501 domain-containing protein [Planctomycetes bacterium]|nr:DUF1501 domain-containing protein [Planctomycetota bacterium]
MLTLLGERRRFCDGVSRRDFLKIGSLALGGIGLPEIFKAEAQAGVGSSQKSVIMVFLVGGAPHIDLFDPKPEAPAEVRGEYKTISTKVPGIRICEHLPRLAAAMDKMVILRSLEGGTEAHASHICLTGYPEGKNGPDGKNGSLEWPSFGSFVSKLQGPARVGVPPFASLAPEMKHAPWGVAGPHGFLGAAHAPFQPQRQAADATTLRDMTLQGVRLERLANRRALLGVLDRFRREVDSSGIMEGMDEFHRQAFEVLTSSKLVEALDLEREDPRVRARYGVGSPENVTSGGPRCMDHFLLARRLVEAGVRCVSLAFGHWDWHSEQYKYLKDDLPPFDQGLSALIEDLCSRGLDRDVSVVVWGEMGRTPRINQNGGRDHWPAVSSALLAGGGMPMGQVIGATNRLGEEVVDRPVHYQNVLATLYHNLGINPETATVMGQAFGRIQPLPLLDKPETIRELI